MEKRYVGYFKEDVIETELNNVMDSYSDKIRAKKELISAFKNKALIYDFTNFPSEKDVIAISTGQKEQ